MPQMDKRFIQCGSYIINLDQIIYIQSGSANTVRIVTTAKGSDGKQHGIRVSEQEAGKLLQALRSLTTVIFDIESKP